MATILLYACGLWPVMSVAGDDRAANNAPDTNRSLPARAVAASPHRETTFYWQVQPLADESELVTLFGRFDHDAPSGEGPLAQRQRTHLNDDAVPVLAVLRDSLGGQGGGGERLLSLWLFTEGSPTVGRRILSALPFYYRRTGDANPPSKPRLTRLADLSAPEGHPFSSVGHDIVQWTLLDGIAMPVRASSRTYRTNELGRHRLYLEEAATFLRLARQGAAPSPLSDAEMDRIMARLRLLKQSFGGLTGDRRLNAVAEADEISRHIAEGRNWEILRQAAEKTGLIFEPLKIGDDAGDPEYAMLWYSPALATNPAPVDSSPATHVLYQLLGIADVQHDRQLAHWKGYAEQRAFDEDGALLPRGERGPVERELIPLAVYSLDYNRQPLLLIDFRDPLHTKRREISQRVVEDVVHNVLGLSYLGNWYFFAGEAAINYVESRRGAARDAGDRADCYARFRVALMLDKGFDSDFRAKLSRGLSRMSTDPLEVTPEWELEAAKLNYAALEEKMGAAKFSVYLDKQRRFELASSRESSEARLRDSMLHLFSFGAYTHREPANTSTRLALEEERQRLATLDFLEQSTKEGVDPGLAENHEEVAEATAKLAKLLSGSAPENERRRAAAIASRLSASRDASLVAGSSTIGTALASSSSPGVKGE